MLSWTCHGPPMDECLLAVMWGEQEWDSPSPPSLQGHVPPSWTLLRHGTTTLHAKGQDWPFPASNVCLKDKPRQVSYDFGMLHVARLILEGWVFTSVQSKKK